MPPVRRTWRSRRSYIFGYTATLRLSSTWQLRSALSNRFLYTGPTSGFQRTNVVTVGLDKSLRHLPGWLSSAGQSYDIEGHVFRDNDVDGAFDAGEPGFANVQVRLDDGHVAITDAAGWFRFRKVTPGVHHLSIDVTRIRGAVMVTTPTEVDVEVIDHGAQVNFGVVNFARVIGAVFNDYNNDGHRQSDAPGLAGITVHVVGSSFTTTVVTDGSGEYEVSDLPPDVYRVSVVPADLPSDYASPTDAQVVTETALSTAVADVPVRALRSISGRVVLKPGTEGGAPRPLAGVVITAGQTRTMTDSEGRYTLRDLPAGLVEIRVVPTRNVPQALHVPFGTVRLGIAPTRIENANIVITNATLVAYVQSADEPVHHDQ